MVIESSLSSMLMAKIGACVFHSDFVFAIVAMVFSECAMDATAFCM